MFPTARLSFHFRDEDKRWYESFLLFCRNGCRRTWCHFFVMDKFLVLFWKLVDEFVSTSADHSQGLRSIMLHGVDVNINAITFQVIRNFDLQHWANLCVPSNPSFWW